jgi:alpha-tubulin suppressor-like RCC1 family protein
MRYPIAAILAILAVFIVSPASASAVECGSLTAQEVETLQQEENLHASEILVKCGLAPSGSSAGPPTSAQTVLGPAFPGSDINVITGTETKPNFDQAESFVWSHGSTVVVNYNDTRGEFESPENISGVSLSTNSGATFTRLGPPSPLKGHGENRGDPIVVYNAKLGEWFAGDLVGECGGGGIGLWTSPEGEKWTVGSCAHTGSSDDRESMWVDNNASSPFYGRMYVSFNNFTNGGDLEVTHSDNGTTWSTPVAVAGTEFRRDTQITGSPGSDGTVLLVGLQESGGAVGATRENYMFRSTTGGETWTSKVMGSSYTIAGGVNCGGRAVVNPIWRAAGNGQPAVGPNGVFMYVYGVHGEGTDESDIFLVRSTNKGETWSAPVRLSTDTTGKAQWQPSLRVTPSGVVEATWYDRRNSTNGENYQRFARVSTDNGATWGTDEPLSTVLIPEPSPPNINACYAGDYNYTTASANTGFDTWTDGRVVVEGTNTEKVFFHSLSLENNAPTVTNVQPKEGPEAGGTSVTITGTHFTGATAVKFGTVAATKFEVKSETSIIATSPAHTAGTVDVTVTTAHGTSETSSADQYTYRSPPAVTSVVPNEGPEAGGTSVTITGTHFTGASAVKFGTVAATKFEVKSETAITATAPAEAAGTVDVTVTTAGGTSATSSADQYTYRSPPTVTSVVPNEGPEAGGTSVTITGTHFTGATAVKFGTVAATKFEVKSETSIVATAPAEAAATVDVTVTAPGGTSPTGSADHYAYRAKPAVANVQPNAGTPSGGTTVMISGTSFTGATKVSFGATSAASFTVISATWISAVSPAGTGTVNVTVTTVGGTSATGSADQFVYRSGGTSLGWGDNSGGELGDGTRTGPETCGEEACSRIPVAASGPVSATAVSAGLSHSLALLSAGTVMSWGENASGELGNGTNTSSDVPVKVSTITTATAVSAGDEYSLALLKSGGVDSWGYNGSGQLGNGTTTSSNVPVAVSGITEATAISAGETHGLALLKNGSVMAWGTNASGQLGNGTTTSSDVPVKVSNISEAVAVSAGYEFSLAVLKNGTVEAWGYNGAGQLGNGTTTNSDVPVAVSSLSEAVSVAAGSAHALALLKGGTVKSWGANQSGQLGNDTCCEHSTVPVKVSNITEATAISAGYHSLAMLRNGTVQDWGRNSLGQLGDGTNTGPETCDDEGSERSCSKIPVAVSSLTGATSIDGGVNYALAVGL